MIPAEDFRGITGAMGKEGMDRPIAAGLAADRPAANLITPNSFYYAIDTDALSFSNGSTWTLDAFALVPTTTTSTVLVLRTTPIILNQGAFGTVAGETEGQDDWGGYTVGNSYITIATAGMYLATMYLAMQSGTGSVSPAVGTGCVMQHQNSGGTNIAPQLGGNHTPSLNGNVGCSGLAECASGDRIAFFGMSATTGTTETWTGRYSVIKLT